MEFRRKAEEMDGYRRTTVEFPGKRFLCCKLSRSISIVPQVMTWPKRAWQQKNCEQKWKAELNGDYVFLKRKKPGLAYRLTKRLIDISVSLPVILLTWPIMLYIAKIIKENSSGSVIFQQRRIKQNRRGLLAPVYYKDPASEQVLKDRRSRRDIFSITGDERRGSSSTELYYLCPKTKTMKLDRRRRDLLGQPFVFYKFRTMYEDAQQRFPELYAYRFTKEEIKNLKFKEVDDPRVPQWAGWLRETSLDELPNFINVLRGEMSIVGPRPDIPEMIRYYSGDQRRKLDAKPGITGLAQIKGRGNLRFQETLKYDIEYVNKQSLLLDIKIIAKTIKEILDGRGAH
jgi:lipopolysaccharide/colanic/teichoic acid biosynthesis glycosyltransferase